MLTRNSYILILLGILGLAAFIFFRPYVDYYADSPISESRAQVEEKIFEISEMLGFSMDSLAVYTSRQQHLRYFTELQDTLEEAFTLQEANAKKMHLQSWLSVIGKKGGSGEQITGPVSAMEKYGRYEMRFSNTGKIIRLGDHEEAPNPTFIKGSSPIQIAETVIGSVLGYDLSMYRFQEDSDSVIVNEEGQAIGGTIIFDAEEETQTGLEFKWVKKDAEDFSLPTYLSITVEAVLKEYEDGNLLRTEFGYKINSFVAKNEYEPEVLTNGLSSSFTAFAFVFIGSMIILVIFIFSVGIKNIFKGKVEWRRALFMFFSVGLGFYGWQALFYSSSFIPFFNNTALLATAINNLIVGIIVGVYMALTYVAWEAFARSQKHAQIDVVDALWQKKIFVRETGSGIINGFALGGILIGLFSILVFALGLFYSQSDSQFGFAEPSSRIQLLTMNMSYWTTTWLVVFAQIGFVYGIVHHWVKKKWVAFVLTLILSSLFLSSLGRVIATNGEFYKDWLIFLPITFVTIYSYRNYGILTTATSWWVFLVMYTITPYWNSPSIEVAYIGWVQAFIVAGPLIYGFISYKYGIPLSEVGDYTPEYEERIAQHLRVEREIEIARESQYKLMPVKPPTADGIDVHGFFLPSFEVGGDYFDYVLSHNKDGSVKALNMVVVDVSGKAMRAAMPAIFTSGLLLSRLKEDSPAQILTEVSEPIFNRTDKRTFITCAIARYCMEDRMLSVANAGHCKPILKRNGKADFIQTPDPKLPLGVKPDVNYQNLEFKLKKGDFFLLYSDGLPEAENEEGKRFGFEEVPALVERIDTDKLSANEIAQEIKRTIQKFSNYQLADDTTVICLKV